MSVSSRQAKCSSELKSKRAVAKRTARQIPTNSTTTCSQNAAVTDLTGRTVLLAFDDVAAYIFHLSRHHAEYLPINDAECELVQAIADCEWRLRRLALLEGGIYALGEKQFAASYTDEGLAARQTLVKTQTHLTYQRQLSNIGLQENRLQRQKSQAIAALESLKSNRPHTPVAGFAQLPAAASSATRAARACASDELAYPASSNPLERSIFTSDSAPGLPAYPDLCF